MILGAVGFSTGVCTHCSSNTGPCCCISDPGLYAVCVQSQPCRCSCEAARGRQHRSVHVGYSVCPDKMQFCDTSACVFVCVHMQQPPGWRAAWFAAGPDVCRSLACDMDTATKAPHSSVPGCCVSVRQCWFVATPVCRCVMHAVHVYRGDDLPRLAENECQGQLTGAVDKRMPLTVTGWCGSHHSRLLVASAASSVSMCLGPCSPCQPQ